MNVITSVRVGDVWHGDHRTNRGRIIRITDLYPYDESPFDPIVFLEVVTDDMHPGDAGTGRYSRASWVQRAYRPGAACSPS